MIPVYGQSQTTPTRKGGTVDRPTKKFKAGGSSPTQPRLVRSRRRRLFFCAAVVIAGVLASISLANLLRNQEERLASAHFHKDCLRRIAAIQNATTDRLNLIDILGAFYSGSHVVERGEFKTFTKPLLERFQGVAAIGWAHTITSADRAMQEQILRDEGFSDYRITELDGAGGFMPVGDRDAYCPIVFIEPFDRFKQRLGFDIFSDPPCSVATEKAWKTGHPAAAVCSPGGKNEAYGRLLYVVVPVKNIDSIANVANRPSTRSFVFGVFDIDAVIGEALDSLLPVDINVQIFDPLDDGAQPVCIWSSGIIGKKALSKSSSVQHDEASVCGKIDVADGHGEVVCTPTAKYLAQWRTWHPTVTLISGLVITALLAGLIFLLSEWNYRIGVLVAQRTRELQASEHRFRQLIENAGDAFFLHDYRGRIVDANKRASDTLGYSREELLSMSIPDIDLRVSADQHRAVWNLPDEKYPITFEGIQVRKDGTTFPVEVRLVPLMIDDRRVLLGLARDVTERKQAEEALRKERHLLRELLDLQEKDRKLVSYEIHDGLAQQLTGTLMRLQSVERFQNRDTEAAQRAFDEAVRLLCAAIVETRRLIDGLRPPLLDERGIAAALEELIAQHKATDSLHVELTHNLAGKRFAPPLEIAVFRIVQESLTNACRYSQSEKIRVELTLADDKIIINVRDWGVGFEPSRVSGDHFGLRGIRERARLLDGTAEVRSSPGDGTHIHAELPISLATEGADNSTAAGKSK